MADQQTIQLTPEDARSLADKLAEFSRTLTPGELARLTHAVQRSMQQGDDVQGFGWWDPFSWSSWSNWWGGDQLTSASPLSFGGAEYFLGPDEN